MSDVLTCDCQDWKDNAQTINDALFLLWGHTGGEISKFFKFCPWCEKELRRVDSQVLEEKKRAKT